MIKITNEKQISNTLIFQKSSLLDGFQKQRASFIKKMKNLMKFFYISRKNVKVKLIESYKPGERYQADIVLFFKLFMR